MASRILAAAAAVATSCALVACGGNSSNNPGAGPTIDITIANGEVTPTNATLQAKVKQQITLHVTSDAADELHVHSVPDHKFEVKPGPHQMFTFSVDVPGNVDLESHHPKRTIATIQVQP